MNNFKEQTISELAAADFRFATIFEKHGIDFFAAGKRTLQEACNNDNIKLDKIKADLRSIIEAVDYKPDRRGEFNHWPLDLLIDYILLKHHKYIAENIPLLETYLAKLCKTYGNQDPSLFRLFSLFVGTGDELLFHMNKEEVSLFPIIKKMVIQQSKGNHTPFVPFDSILNPIRVMMHEHGSEGNNFKHIRTLCNNYLPPAGVSSLYKETFVLLHEFEENLHVHVHLENNILFPKSMALEATLAN
jgi:regulator of cell morphogenesis and NO signaling